MFLRLHHKLLQEHLNNFEEHITGSQGIVRIRLVVVWRPLAALFCTIRVNPSLKTAADDKDKYQPVWHIVPLIL